MHLQLYCHLHKKAHVANLHTSELVQMHAHTRLHICMHRCGGKPHTPTMMHSRCDANDNICNPSNETHTFCESYIFSVRSVECSQANRAHSQLWACLYTHCLTGAQIKISDTRLMNRATSTVTLAVLWTEILIGNHRFCLYSVQYFMWADRLMYIIYSC